MSNVFVTLWDKVKAFVASTEQSAVVVLTADEKELLTLFKPLLGAAEATVLGDLKGAVLALLAKAGSGAITSLPDLETALLNELQTLGSELLPVAKGLGSDVLQAFIGLVRAQI